jgi:hypothetical protein
MRTKKAQTQRTAPKAKVGKRATKAAQERSNRDTVSSQSMDVASDPTAADRREPEAGFIPDPGKTHAPVPDDLAEYLGESFVEAAVSGADVATETQDELVPEELGGPFVNIDLNTDLRAVFAENINLAMQMDAEEELDAKLDALMDGEPHADDGRPAPTRQDADGLPGVHSRRTQPGDERADGGPHRDRRSGHRVYVPGK